MDQRSEPKIKPSIDSLGRQTIRKRIFSFVSALIVLSVLGSTYSLYRITAVNHSLEGINQVSVPLGRLMAQMQTDSEVFRRELERGLGFSHWKDPHWRPRAVPGWIADLLRSEIQRGRDLLNKDVNWAPDTARARWESWLEQVSQGLIELSADASKLYEALAAGDEALASETYPRWNSRMTEWASLLQWGSVEYDRFVRQAFAQASDRVAQLRTGLEVLLVVVVLLSLLLLWVGERALRPLGELTRLARQITQRGLKREDKALLAEVPLARTDEVSQLAREFHRMATSLLEREKAIGEQKRRVQEQNELLREMGSLNESILFSIRSVLIVTDLQGRITQCNPEAARWLGIPNAQERLLPENSKYSDSTPGGVDLFSLPVIRLFSGSDRWMECLMVGDGAGVRIPPTAIGTDGDQRIFGGHLLPLRQERPLLKRGMADSPGNRGIIRGAILVLEDLTDESRLQERLRQSESLAVIGRMSAQVAHEVRNPLHSIGLEAEMAVELAQRQSQPQLKQSLQSILSSVDRLQKITENYLKLSRLSAGRRSKFDLGEVLNEVLATYGQACEQQGVQVDWTRPSATRLEVLGDRDLIEQALGNLMRNALQALEGQGEGALIRWSLGQAESGRTWLQIEDNGAGIQPELRERLFVPFFTTRAQGTGLGLSFVKKVIEDHHGSVVCVEKREASGACFLMTFPPAPDLELTDVPESGREELNATVSTT